MAHRQEEKEKRRAEREAAEREAAEAQARRQRLMLIGGGVLALAALVGLVLAFTSLLGGDSAKDSDGPSGGPKVSIPKRQVTDLDAAAQLAGCKVANPPDEGRGHTAKSGVKVTYRSNPPTSGQHDPVPANDGIYDPGNEPTKESAVHALEHGRIELQYAPGTPQRRIKQLETLYGEALTNAPGGYHELLFQNQTKMPFAVAGVAWNHYVGCKTFNDKVFDVLRAFREAYTDRGPEVVP
jgi:hypothetical protein